MAADATTDLTPLAAAGQACGVGGDGVARCRVASGDPLHVEDNGPGWGGLARDRRRGVRRWWGGRLRVVAAGPSTALTPRAAAGAAGGKGDAGVARCPWASGDPLNVEYHDTEWGVAVHGESPLLERITLEAFQSGLSWLTILRKRPDFRRSFAGFDADVLAPFDDDRVEKLMADASIVRNRAKILAARTSAAAKIGRAHV